MNDLQQKQRGVVKAMIASVTFSIGFIVLAYKFAPFAQWEFSSIGEQLAFTLQCDLFAILMLMAGIGNIARQRFFSEEAMDGAREGLSPAIEINLRYMQNTFEQCFLLLIGHLVLATLISPSQMRIIPILVALFIIGRITFWIGYHKNPLGRAFGFATTFYPIVCVILYDIYGVVGRLF